MYLSGIDGPKVLCVFCNAPWDTEMELQMSQTQGCDTCGYGSTTSYEVTVTCTNCGKVVYKKEGSN